MSSDIRMTTIEKIKWILNSTGAVFEVVKDQTCCDKRPPVWLDGKSQRQACCSCYWWYVTLEPHLSFINTSKGAVRSDTVNRKSRPMTICLHECPLCIFKTGEKVFQFQVYVCKKCSLWWMQTYLRPPTRRSEHPGSQIETKTHKRFCLNKWPKIK